MPLNDIGRELALPESCVCVCVCMCVCVCVCVGVCVLKKVSALVLLLIPGYSIEYWGFEVTLCV